MFPYVALLCPKVGLYCSKAESRVPGGGWWWVVVVQTNNHVKPNFRWIVLGCFGVVLWLSCGFDNLKLTKSPYFLWKPNLTQWWTFKENSTQLNLTYGFWLWSSPACFIYSWRIVMILYYLVVFVLCVWFDQVLHLVVKMSYTIFPTLCTGLTLIQY